MAKSQHTTTPEVQPSTACLLRTQERLVEIIADVGESIGNDAAARIGAKAVELFSAVKIEVRQ